MIMKCGQHPSGVTSQQLSAGARRRPSSGKLQKKMLDTVFAEGINSHRCAMACLQTLADAKLDPADLAPLYEFLCQEVGWNPDAPQLKRMP